MLQYVAILVGWHKLKFGLCSPNEITGPGLNLDFLQKNISVTKERLTATTGTE